MEEQITQFIISVAPAIAAVIGNLIIALKYINNLRGEVKEVKQVKVDASYEALKKQNEELIRQNYEMLEEMKALKKTLSKGRE